MYVLVTYKNEEDQMKNELKRMVKTELYFRHSRAANYSYWSSVPKIKLIIAFIVVLVPARMMKIHPEMKTLECSQHYSHYRSMEIFQTFKGS